MMKKYPYEVKIKVVHEYLNELATSDDLIEKYGLTNSSNIQTWVRLYKKYGKKGLKESERQSVFPVQFKLDVLSYRERTGSSYQKTADEFNIRFGSTVRDWHKTVQNEGVEALEETKGRTPMAEIDRRNKEKKALKNQQLKEFNAKRFAELERENELLRLENAYLKKLEAFQANRLPEKLKLKRRIRSSRKDLN